MIVIKVGNKENIDRALKRYKYKVYKTKQLEKVRERQQYIKNSEKRRKQKQKAEYLQKLKGSED